jgi:hypothetical protein
MARLDYRRISSPLRNRIQVDRQPPTRGLVRFFGSERLMRYSEMILIAGPDFQQS